VDKLNSWWRANERDEVAPPDWSDVTVLFKNWSDEQLIDSLPYMRSGAAVLAAMGARMDERGDKKFVPYILRQLESVTNHLKGDQSRNFNASTHRHERLMARAALALVDEWYGCYALWDFLGVAIQAYQQANIMIQRRLL
jgi:hypothetical protein